MRRSNAFVAFAAFAACGRYGYDGNVVDPDGGLAPVDAAPDALAPPADATPDAAAPTADATPPPDASTGCTTGCPTGISLGSPTSMTIVGGASGGPYNDRCPAGQVIIGYDGGMPSFMYMGAITATCATLAITPGTLAVTTTPAGQLPTRGTDMTLTWSAHCGANQIIFGVSGRCGAYIDQLVFTCARLAVTAQPNGSYTLGYELTTALPAVGGTGGGPFPPQICANGGLVVGDTGRSGQWVDAFALVCSVPALSF